MKSSVTEEIPTGQLFIVQLHTCYKHQVCSCDRTRQEDSLQSVRIKSQREPGSHHGKMVEHWVQKSPTFFVVVHCKIWKQGQNNPFICVCVMYFLLYLLTCLKQTQSTSEKNHCLLANHGPWKQTQAHPGYSWSHMGSKILGSLRLAQ